MKRVLLFSLSLILLAQSLQASPAEEGANFLRNLFQNDDLGEGVAPFWAKEFEGKEFQTNRKEAEAEVQRKKIQEHLGRAGLDPMLEIFDPFFLNIFRTKISKEVQTFQSDGDFFTEVPNHHTQQVLKSKYEEEWVNVDRETKNLRPIKLKKINGIDYLLPVSAPSSALLKAKHTLSPADYEQFEKDYDLEAERLAKEVHAIALLKDSHSYLMLRFKSAQKRIQALLDRINETKTIN